ncbi:MAG: Flp1 family type IVb pilin [Bacillota bacterium]|nr:Flp1 family type IVb pilin [Bacillota bacterium]
MSKKLREKQQRRPGLVKDERGMGTLEVVIIIAALLALAILFNTQIRAFADRAFQLVFNDNRIVDVLGE